MWCRLQLVTKSVFICLYIITFLNSSQILAFHMWEVVLVVTPWCKVFVALQFIWVGNKLCENLFSVLGFSIFQEFDKIDSSSFIVYSCFPFLLTSLEKKLLKTCSSLVFFLFIHTLSACLVIMVSTCSICLLMNSNFGHFHKIEGKR